MKPERQKYDPAQPCSFCDQCHQLGWARKRKSRWLCAKCTKAIIEREQAILTAKAELARERELAAIPANPTD